MWLRKSTRVRGVTPAQIASTTASGRRQAGRRLLTIRRPRARWTKCQVRSQAPYSWSVVRDLVAGVERERARDDVDAGVTFVDVDDIVGVGAEVGCQAARASAIRSCSGGRGTRPAGARARAAALVALEDRPRAGAERAVVEEGRRRVEEKERSEVVRHQVHQFPVGFVYRGEKCIRAVAVPGRGI